MEIMIRFKQFIREFADMDKLYGQLTKAGYPKYKQVSKKAVFVYVPKSDRAVAMDDIAKKLGGVIDKDPTVMRKFSSIGAVGFEDGPYEGMHVGVKPDTSGGLKTDEQETLAGIFISAKLRKPDTEYSFEDLQKYGDTYTMSAYKIAKLYDKAGKGWINSSTVIADKLYTLYKGQQFNVHQRSGSKFEANISKAAKVLIKKAGHVMGLDKWNPADIWLVKKEFEKTDFSQFKTIKELNAWIETHHKKKNVIGVSLKQVGKTAKTQIFNSGKAAEVRYSSYDVGKKGFPNAINGTIHFNNGSFVLRSFGRPESISAEINGAMAQGGKVGSGPLMNIVKRYNPRFSTPTHQQITRDYKNNPLSVVRKLHNHMKRFDPTSARKYKDHVQFHDFIKKKPNELIYVISKLQSSDVIAAILQMNKATKDHFVSSVIAYASSSTEISSMFIKVS